MSDEVMDLIDLSIQDLEALAAEGDYDAVVAAGVCFWLGHGVRQNCTIAAKHFLVASMHGQEDAIAYVKEAQEATGKEDLSVKDFAQILQKTSGKNGCYIATAVYGSYDCPEVWTLRRFRDNIL